MMNITHHTTNQAGDITCHGTFKDNFHDENCFVTATKHGSIVDHSYEPRTTAYVCLNDLASEYCSANDLF